MARIPIEDTFLDVINKAQRGLKINDENLAQRAEVSLDEILAVKSGRIVPVTLRRIARHLRLGPDALEALANQSWYPTAPVFARGFQVFNTPHDDMTVNSYLVWDPKTKVAAAFDTGGDCSDMLGTIDSERLDVQYIFLTHTHDDHIADLDRLAKHTKAPVWASELEPAPYPGAKTFQEDAHFHLGEIAIKTLFTWGHSPGMTTFFVTGLSWPLAIVGDAIFAGSMGGSEHHFTDQLRNNYDKIYTLPRNTVLACGHGPLTTLAIEKKNNPFFAR